MSKNVIEETLTRLIDSKNAVPLCDYMCSIFEQTIQYEILSKVEVQLVKKDCEDYVDIASSVTFKFSYINVESVYKIQESVANQFVKIIKDKGYKKLSPFQAINSIKTDGTVDFIFFCSAKTGEEN